MVMRALRDSMLPLAAACLLAACSQPAEPPAAASSPAAAAPKAAPVRYDIEAFMDTVQLSGAAFSPDGQSLV